MASAKGYVPLSQETGNDAGMSAAATNRRAQCDLCKLSYSKEEELTEHLVSLLHHIKLEHKDKNPIHICTLCHETSTNMDNYRAHIATDKHHMRLCQLRGEDWNYVRPFKPGNKKHLVNFRNRRFNNKRQYHFQTSGDPQGRNSHKRHSGSTFFRNNQHENTYYQDSINWPNASNMNSSDRSVNGFRRLMAFGQNVTASEDMNRRMGHSTAVTEESGYKPWGSGVSGRYCNRPTCQGLARPCIHSSGQAQTGQQSDYATDFTSDTILTAWDEQDLLQQEQFLANFNDTHFVNHQYIYVRPVVSQVAGYPPSVAPGVVRQPSNSLSERAGHPVAETRFGEFSNMQNGPAELPDALSRAQSKFFDGHHTLPSDTNMFKRAGSNTSGFSDRTVFHQSNTDILHSNQDPFHFDRREPRLSNELTCSSAAQQTQGKENVTFEPDSVHGLERLPPSQSSPCPLVTASSEPGTAASTLDEIKKSIEKMVVHGEESAQKTLKDLPLSQGKRKRCSSAGMDLDNNNEEDLTTTKASSIKRTSKPQLSTDHIKKIINAPYSRDERVQLAKIIQSRDVHKASTHGALRPNLQLEMSCPSASTSEEVASEKNPDSCVQTIKLEDLADSVRSQIMNLIGLDVLAHTEGPTNLNSGKKVEGNCKTKKDSKSRSKPIVLSDNEASSQTKKKKMKSTKTKNKTGENIFSGDVSAGKDLSQYFAPSVESSLMTLYKDDRKSKSLHGKERHRHVNKEKVSKKLKSQSQRNIEQPMLDAICVSSPESIIIESQDARRDHSTIVASKKKSSSVVPQCEPVLVTDSDSGDCTEILAEPPKSLEVSLADVPEVDVAVLPSDAGGRKQIELTSVSKSSRSPVVDKRAKKVVLKYCESEATQLVSDSVVSANKKNKVLDQVANSANESIMEGQTNKKNKDKLTDTNSDVSNNNNKHKKINVVVIEGADNKKVKNNVSKLVDICDTDCRKKKKSKDMCIDPATDGAKEDQKNKKRKEKVFNSDHLNITEREKNRKDKDTINDPVAAGTTKDKKKRRDKKKVADMMSEGDKESRKSKSSKKHKSRLSTVSPMDTGQSPEDSTASADVQTTQVSLTDPSGSAAVLSLTCGSTLSTSSGRQPKPSLLQSSIISSSLDREIYPMDTNGAEDSPAACETPQLAIAELVAEDTTVLNNSHASFTGSANNNNSFQAVSANNTRTSPTNQSKSTHSLLTPSSKGLCSSPTNSLNKSHALQSVVLNNTQSSQSDKSNNVKTSQSDSSNSVQTSQLDVSVAAQTSQSVSSNSVQTLQSDSLNSVQNSQSNVSNSIQTLPADAMSSTNTSLRPTLLPSTWLHRSCSADPSDTVVQASRETSSEPSLTIIDDDEDEPVDVKEREALVQSGELSSHIMSRLLLISENEENVRQEKMSLDLRLSRLYKLVEQAMVQINQCTDRRKQLQEQEQECSKQRLTLLREAASVNSSKKTRTNDGVTASTSDLHQQLSVNQIEQSVCVPPGAENSQGSLSKADWLAKFSSYLPHDAETVEHPSEVEKVETSAQMGSAVLAASSLSLTPSKQPATHGHFELPRITEVRGMFTAHNLLFRPSRGSNEGRDNRDHSEESSQEEGAKSQEEGVNSQEGGAVVDASRLKSTFPQLSRHLLSGPVMYLGTFMSKDTSCSGDTLKSGCVSE